MPGLFTFLNSDRFRFLLQNKKIKVVGLGVEGFTVGSRHTQTIEPTWEFTRN